MGATTQIDVGNQDPFDPRNLLNPGVILSDGQPSKNIKPMAAVDPAGG